MITTLRSDATQDDYIIRLLAVRYGECKRQTQISADILIPV